MRSLRYDQIDLYPLECHQGEDKVFVMLLKKRDGSIYDLTGATIKGQARSADNTTRFDLRPQITNASAGQVILTVAPNQVSSYGKYYYDLQITKNNKVDYLQPSSFRILQTVTDSNISKDISKDEQMKADVLYSELLTIEPPGTVEQEYSLTSNFTRIVMAIFADLTLQAINSLSIDLRLNRVVAIKTSAPIATSQEIIIIGVF